MGQDQKLPRIHVVKRIYVKPDLLILDILPLCTYAHAPVILPVLKITLYFLYCYGCETCCHVLLNFVCGHKNLEFWEELDVRERRAWRNLWLWDG
jgi:hypothetical protein